MFPRGRALHIGAGGNALPTWLEGFKEVSLDINPESKPDILGSMTEMGPIGDFALVYSSHCLEHLYPHEVPVALAECYRVLNEGGKLLVVVPDIEDVRPSEEVYMNTPCGPITGFDMFYGHRASIKHSIHMAHHTGFTQKTLTAEIEAAGFKDVIVNRVGNYNLMGGGTK